MKKRQKIVKSRYRGSYGLFRFFLAFSVILVQIALPIAPVFGAEETASDPSSMPPQIEAASSEVTRPSESNAPSNSLVDDESTAPDVLLAPSSETEVSNNDGEVSPEISGEIVSESQNETETLEDTPSSEESAPTDGEATVSSDTGETTASSTELLPDAPPEVTPGIETPSSTTTEVTNEEDNATTSDEVVLEEENVLEEEITTEDGTPEATTTEEITENVVEAGLHTVTNDENRYTFGVNECARVADGSFYCSEKSETSVVSAEDRVFSAPDQDGDSEIFVERGGEITQLTFNTLDDAAPFYDERSGSIVFHRLIDGRYQIVTLDMETGTENILTRDSYNNMQPSRSGDLIVWQGWVGSDWEILMSNDGEVTMLTDNTTHDIGPRINGNYIIWQSEEVDGWMVKVYNTETKRIETVTDAEGASAENPRLVLVYDAKHENGDVETRGYDLETGKSVALTQEAPELPDKLPDPDQTGEDRALINTVTQLKPKTSDSDDEPEPLPMLPELPLETGSSTDAGDIVIPPFDLGTTTVDTPSELPISEMPTTTSLIEDLVVDAVQISNEEPPVEDLIIPAFVAEALTTTDPQ